MKIISKFKDYYDYLQGIYGIDEKLILDRTEFTSKSYVDTTYPVVRLHICDFLVEGIVINNEILYGMELEKYNDTSFRFSWKSEEDSYKVRVGGNKYRDVYKILKKPKKLKNSPNRILNCPIILDMSSKDDENNYIKHPILKDFNIIKVFSPEEMWLNLSEWLGKEVPIKDNRSDKEKITSKGFDLIKSFRNIK